MEEGPEGRFVLYYPASSQDVQKSKHTVYRDQAGMNTMPKYNTMTLLTAGIDTFIATVQTIEMWEKLAFW